ncbi:DUF6783 domain-containing protein [Blautia producta]
MICGGFVSDKGGTAGCIDRIGVKYTAKWDVQFVVIIFQIGSRILLF